MKVKVNNEVIETDAIEFLSRIYQKEGNLKYDKDEQTYFKEIEYYFVITLVTGDRIRIVTNDYHKLNNERNKLEKKLIT